MKLPTLQFGKKLWYLLFALNFIHIIIYPIIGVWFYCLDVQIANQVLSGVLARIDAKLMLTAFFVSPINWAFFTYVTLYTWGQARKSSKSVF